MNEQDKRRLRDCFLENAWFKILSFLAVAMLITSMILPPQGVIDPSVIGGVGEIFAFSALWSVIYAINHGHGAQITHGNTTVVIKDMDGNIIGEGKLGENNEE